MTKSAVAILGAGSWGTAVGMHLASSGLCVNLWTRSQQHALDMSTSRMNQAFLPGIAFPETLNPSADLEYCLSNSSTVIIAVPSSAFREVLNEIKQPQNGLAWLSKGIDPISNKFLSQLVLERFGPKYPIAMITGPSFATEVAKKLPTALLIAGNNMPYQQHLYSIFHHNNIRTYQSHDLIGVQVCGAVKNILAIAAGITDGLEFGANTRAALITRGLAEMSRLGIHFGAKIETFMGLAGIGDLVLTCTDNQSRNRRFGLSLGQGLAQHQAQKSIKQVIEGQHNVAQICAVANKEHIEMPICNAVYDVLKGVKTAAEAVSHLMNRPPKNEY